MLSGGVRLSHIVYFRGAWRIAANRARGQVLDWMTNDANGFVTILRAHWSDVIRVFYASCVGVELYTAGVFCCFVIRVCASGVILQLFTHMGTPGTKRKRSDTRDNESNELTDMPPTPVPRAIRAKPLILSSEAVLRNAIHHLSRAEPVVLKPLIDEHGLPTSLLAKRNCSCFHALAQTIVYQQLSIKAARPIFQRVLSACKVEAPAAAASLPPAVDDVDDDSQVFDSSAALTPAAVLATDTDALRGAGLSTNKTRFLVDLAQFFDDGRLSDEALQAAEVEEVSNMLLQVKGLGPWSVTMFQMFHLGHADVMPLGDLGVRRGLAHLYKSAVKDDKDTAGMERVTQSWAPYRSVGAWYMWRVKVPRRTKAKPH